MPGLGSITTTLITTRGLFTAQEVLPVGFTALTFGAGITPWFRLYITEVPVPPPVENYVAAVGSRVYAPGEIAQLYRPIDPNTGLPVGHQVGQEPYFVPLDKEAEFFRKNKIVTFKINFAGRDIDRTYSVSEARANALVEAINIVNATKNRISIVASGVKKLANEAVIKVGKLKLRKNHDK